MFKHPIRTIIRKMPLSAWAMLGWTQRHSVGLWWRSIVAEAKRDEPLSLKRWATLFKALVKVSGDHRLANARALKQLTVDGSAVVATATQNWSERGTLTTVLEGVSEASDVRISSSSPVDRPWSATGPVDDGRKLSSPAGRRVSTRNLEGDHFGGLGIDQEAGC